MNILYVTISKNRMSLRDLDTGREAVGHGSFSNQRILIGAFFAAEKVLRDLIEQVKPQGLLDRFVRRRRYDIVIDALELNEGGLSQVEERAIMEMAAGASAMRYRQMVVACAVQPRTDDAVRALLAQSTNQR